MKAIFLWFAIVALGAVFFSYNEEWTFIDGLYWAVVTSATVRQSYGLAAIFC